MDLQHFAIKLFAVEPLTYDLDQLNPVFNRWIQAQSLPELLIDVADYRHVHNGPGLMLIGHQAHYSFDQQGGRWGLLYSRKAAVEGGTQAALTQALAAVVAVAQKLEKETKLRFDVKAWQLTVNDRLLAPNTAETYAALQPALAAALDPLLGTVSFTYQGPGRHRLTVNVAAPQAPRLAELARRLSAATPIAA